MGALPALPGEAVGIDRRGLAQPQQDQYPCLQHNPSHGALLFESTFRFHLFLAFSLCLAGKYPKARQE